jgi:hypothetical protein
MLPEPPRDALGVEEVVARQFPDQALVLKPFEADDTAELPNKEICQLEDLDSDSTTSNQGGPYHSTDEPHWFGGISASLPSARSCL